MTTNELQERLQNVDRCFLIYDQDIACFPQERQQWVRENRDTRQKYLKAYKVWLVHKFFEELVKPL